MNFITSKETAARLGISVDTLIRWRKAGKGPSAYRVGRCWKYDEPEVTAYIQACRVQLETDRVG